MTCRCEHCGSLLHDLREWSEAEDFQLADLLATGLKSAEIAQHVGRSRQDVLDRIKRLKLADGRQMGAFRKRQDWTRPTPARTMLERYFEVA